MESIVVLRDIIFQAYHKGPCTKPLIVGLQGIQGSGKTTLSRRVAQELNKSDINTIVISIDDFYLPRSQLIKLHEESGNSLWKTRGLPGTHDLDAIYTCFNALKTQETPAIPRYDKSLYNGEGDRSHIVFVPPPSVDVVIFEGWCLGFIDQDSSYVQSLYNEYVLKHQYIDFTLKDVQLVNNELSKYRKVWSFLDLFIQIQAPNVKCAYVWRWHQELEMKTKCGLSKGMTEEQVRIFVDRFMICYHLYLLTVKPHFRIYIDDQHKFLKSESLHLHNK